jgi:choice-of-anchor B domain-containing protein
LEDLDNPVLHFSYRGATNAIDHNGYVINDLLYLANYTAGIRVIDIKNIENKQMSEVGYFDTYPKDNSTDFAGVWNVYPFFESGVILISDLNKGLFLVKKSE